MSAAQDRVVVIGAGMGGLSAAARLAARGMSVTVLEQHNHPGGKMRTLDSPVGPVDAGPTVLTMRPVFEDLFASCGENLSDHVTLEAETVLARHWWRDGSSLDLHADPEASAAAIRAWGGAEAEQDFRRFDARMARLFEAFKGPMMESAQPSQMALTAKVLSRPGLIPAMAPLSKLMPSLRRQFRDARLAQLFGRYATYVGGSPYRAPALLGLIWRSEAGGVWRVKGGMHRLAHALADLVKRQGGEIHLRTGAARIEVQGGRVAAVITDTGDRIATRHVVFNGDPQALGRGALGPAARNLLPPQAVAPRSLSAYVWSFAAVPRGPELIHHNVFFGNDPRTEFDALHAGKMPVDPTLYICAEDRAGSRAPPEGMERFEIIMNGPPSVRTEAPTQKETTLCRTRTFQALAQAGLTFSPAPAGQPGGTELTTPADFARLFPASDGSLYGRSPHGMMSAFARPTAQTRLPGLILAGGGAHPGAGIPMATLSGKHAAETILKDRASISPSRRTATRGGISTGSPTMAGVQSRSSAS